MHDQKNKTKVHSYESYQPHLQPIDKPKGDKRAKINAWLAGHKKIVLGAIIAVTIFLGGGIAYLFNGIQYDPVPVASTTKKTITKAYSKLTGVEVSAEDATRPVTGAMVENSPEARPQSGVKEAGVVFESVAEGGITRFLLLYQESKPAMIGPVRSVRPQFASWVAAFDAGLAHVGGSDIPLQKLRSGQIKDLDQFFNESTYTRASNRAAPHNVYTSDAKLQALNKSKGYNSSTFTAWKRKTKESPSQTPTAKTINIPVSTGLFNVSYSWDPASNTYTRSEGGVLHLDREQGQIAPKVVIAMQVPHDVIRDSNGYSYPDVNTSGKAWLFQDGIVSEISWSKAGDKEQIQFKDAASKPVELNPGQTWITAIKPDKVATWQ